MSTDCPNLAPINHHIGHNQNGTTRICPAELREVAL
jgi:hypothetical protein